MATAVNYPTQSARDQYLRDQLGRRYDQILHERIFDRMTPKINPSCDGANKYKTTAAYGYASKSDTQGIITSSIVKKGHCGGEGGYYWSTREFANYVAHFSDTNLIVSDAARDAMFSEGMASDDRLIWTAAKAEDWMKTKFKMPVVVWSNGIVEGSRTVLIRLPQNHFLILFTNSEDMSAGDLYNAGVAAFKAGMEHNFS